MDDLGELGRSIELVISPTYKVCAPLVEANAPAIEATLRQTHTYGPHFRHQLDIYAPSTWPAESASTRPIMVFLYGGGFTTGERISQARPLFYQNVGHFFAEKAGLETVVMDYRLVQHGAEFPSGAEDLALALSWIKQRYSGQSRDLLLLGNSAGGIHLCTWLFEPNFGDSRLSVLHESPGLRLAGVVLLGVLYHFRGTSTSFLDSLCPYLGSNPHDQSPWMSFERCRESGQLGHITWPQLILVDSEFDPVDIIDANRDFVELLKGVGNVPIQYLQAKGHNHISPPLVLGTGNREMESWAYEALSLVVPEANRSI